MPFSSSGASGLAKEAEPGTPALRLHCLRHAHRTPPSRACKHMHTRHLAAVAGGVDVRSGSVGLAQTVYMPSIFFLFCGKISEYAVYIHGLGQPHVRAYGLCHGLPHSTQVVPQAFVPARQAVDFLMAQELQCVGLTTDVWLTVQFQVV